MKKVRITKTYLHTGRRTWVPGDTPVVSSDLAEKIVLSGCGEIVDDVDGVRMRGVTQEEIEDVDMTNNEEVVKSKKKPRPESDLQENLGLGFDLD